MSEINKELIESYRKIVLPFVSNQLCKADFEGQGEIDKTEFEQDFNEILDLAISSLNPQGDCISREALKEEVRKHAEYYADRTEEDRYNTGYTECACEILDFIDNAPTIEPRIEYGTDGQPYKLSMTNGKEYERPQVEKEPVFKSVPTYRKYEDYHDAEQYVRGWNDAMRYIFGIEDK